MPLKNLAMLLLQYLEKEENTNTRHPENMGRKELYKGYPKDERIFVARCIMEAFSYLQSEILIAREPMMESASPFYFITRKGKEVLKSL